MEILEKDKATLSPGVAGYVYVYLGYVAGPVQRTGASRRLVQKGPWKIAEADIIRDCAEGRLKEPLTWIRHLEAAVPKS